MLKSGSFNEWLAQKGTVIEMEYRLHTDESRLYTRVGKEFATH
jgi:hypothetical protein